MIHNTTVIDDNVTIHPTARIWHWTHIRENVTIGKNVIIGQGCYIDHDVFIPKGCKIQNHVSIYYGVKLSEYVFIGPHVGFCNDKHPRSWQATEVHFKQTTIEKGVSIGAGAVILPGISIGEYAMIGAGAVVTDDVPPRAIVVGNPARIIGYDKLCRNTNA